MYIKIKGENLCIIRSVDLYTYNVNRVLVIFQINTEYVIKMVAVYSIKNTLYWPIFKGLKRKFNFRCLKTQNCYLQTSR